MLDRAIASNDRAFKLAARSRSRSSLVLAVMDEAERARQAGDIWLAERLNKMLRSERELVRRLN